LPSLYAHDPFLAVQHALAAPWLDPVMATLTTACEGWAMALVAAVFVAWRERRAAEILRVLAPLYLGLLLAGAAVQALKFLVASPRPLAVLGAAAVHVQLEPLYSNSFPSGHSASAAALATFALVRYRVRAWPLALLALLGGTSRVYVGAHWVTDVLGGWTVGALVALGTTPLFDAARRRVRALLPPAPPEGPEP
jgi:undecaprenyl-diphosphatase